MKNCDKTSDLRLEAARLRDSLQGKSVASSRRRRRRRKGIEFCEILYALHSDCYMSSSRSQKPNSREIQGNYSTVQQARKFSPTRDARDQNSRQPNGRACSASPSNPSSGTQSSCQIIYHQASGRGLREFIPIWVRSDKFVCCCSCLHDGCSSCSSRWLLVPVERFGDSCLSPLIWIQIDSYWSPFCLDQTHESYKIVHIHAISKSRFEGEKSAKFILECKVQMQIQWMRYEKQRKFLMTLAYRMAGGKGENGSEKILLSSIWSLQKSLSEWRRQNKAATTTTTTTMIIIIRRLAYWGSIRELEEQSRMESQLKGSAAICVDPNGNKTRNATQTDYYDSLVFFPLAFYCSCGCCLLSCCLIATERLLLDESSKTGKRNRNCNATRGQAETSQPTDSSSNNTKSPSNTHKTATGGTLGASILITQDSSCLLSAASKWQPLESQEILIGPRLFVARPTGRGEMGPKEKTRRKSKWRDGERNFIGFNLSQLARSQVSGLLMFWLLLLFVSLDFDMLKFRAKFRVSAVKVSPWSLLSEFERPVREANDVDDTRSHLNASQTSFARPYDTPDSIESDTNKSTSMRPSSGDQDLGDSPLDAIDRLKASLSSKAFEDGDKIKVDRGGFWSPNLMATERENEASSWVSLLDDDALRDIKLYNFAHSDHESIGLATGGHAYPLDQLQDRSAPSDRMSTGRIIDNRKVREIRGKQRGESIFAASQKAERGSRKFVGETLADEIPVWSPSRPIPATFVVHALESQQNRHPTSIQSNCPAECQCVWKNGKQFADCSIGRLAKSSSQQATIPSGLDPLLQVLNLTGNPLRRLEKLAFASLNLNNLQRIYLSR